MHKPKHIALKTWLRIKQTFLKIWEDSVWSNVISTGIIIAIPLGWAKITNHSWSEIYKFLISVLSFKLPLFVFLSVIALFFIGKKIIQLFKKRKDPFWDEQIGNYTFNELYNILLTETLQARTRGMAWSGRDAPSENLLSLFQIYYSTLNIGFGLGNNIDDGGYLYGVFAPRLVGYGLVDEYQKPDDDLPNRTDVAYKTSVFGHKFHSSLDKLILSEKMKELKAQKKN